jgi:hypothetical protein
MDFKIFYCDEEITDEDIFIKLIPVLKIRTDWKRIPKHINYVVRIGNLNNEEFMVEYFTYSKLLQSSKIIDKQAISSLIREYVINKILND